MLSNARCVDASETNCENPCFQIGPKTTFAYVKTCPTRTKPEQLLFMSVNCLYEMRMLKTLQNEIGIYVAKELD